MKKKFLFLVCLAVSFLFIVPVASFAAEYTDFVPTYSTLGFNGELVLDDISSVRLSVPVQAEVAGTAKAYIMFGDEVKAETDDIKTEEYWSGSPKTTSVIVTFAAPVRLLGGNTYRLVIPAGTFRNHVNPSELYGELSQSFEVPDGFVGKDSQLYDGCELPSVHFGGFDFGKVELEKVGDPKVSLYNGGELIASVDVSLSCHKFHPGMHSYINFTFPVRVNLERGACYTLVFPEGGLRSKVKPDVVSRELRISVTGAACKVPVLGEADQSGIVYKGCSMGYSAKAMIGDVESPSFFFGRHVAVKDGAAAYIMQGDEVMAVSDSLYAEDQSRAGEPATRVYARFSAPVRLPKGTDYQLVIPAGALCDKDDMSVVVGKFVYGFTVPGDFEGIPGDVNDYSDRLYDGCTLPVLSDGNISFGNIPTAAAVENPHVSLCKGGIVVAEGDAEVGADWDTGYLYFKFGEVMKLEPGAHYELVLPAGIAHATDREDIVNKEMRINIYGPQSGTGVSSATSSGLSVSCAGGVLHVSGASVGTPIEVFTIGGSMVRSCKAQSGSVQMPLPGKGCYVVRVGGKTKVVEC